jgi:ABC-type antimicrobial peptide transport system permease subunit
MSSVLTPTRIDGSAGRTSNNRLCIKRVNPVLALVFSVMSVLMVLIGLYSFVAYDTTQRSREFAIRCALGAQKADMASLLAKEVALVLVPGD